MSNGQPPPSLALGDIIRLTSPSQVQMDSASIRHNPEHQSESPEPVSAAEQAGFVKRLSELGLSAKDSLDVSQRERELVDMILRLANDTRPDRSQLVFQADIIASLKSQRDYLVQQVEEQRGRWASESDGWARMAEALIAQRNKSSNSGTKDEDLERQCASFESDNKALREKLAEVQTRLTSLESELSRLRPLLLMQPVSLAPSNPASTSAIPSRQKPVSMRKKKDKVMSSPAVPDDQQLINVDLDSVINDTAVSPAMTNHYSSPKFQDQTRTEDLHHPQRTTKRHKVSKSSTIPLTSDARAEHLLLAARKIGRQRVEMLARLQAAEMKDSEDERRDSWVTSPKTPKRPSENLHPYSTHSAPHAFAPTSEKIHTPHGLNPAFVFLNSQMGLSPSFPGSPLHTQFILPIPGYPPMQTPTKKPSFDKNSNSGTGTSPQTPLDSLLSAARSMMDSGSTPRANRISSSAAADSNGKTRLASVVEMPESPVPPKRRKIAGASKGGNAGLVRRTQFHTQADAEAGVFDSADVRRVKSALDVLADQAAVFSSNERGRKGKIRKSETRQKSVEPREVSPTGKTRMKEAGKKDKSANGTDKESTVERKNGEKQQTISQQATDNDEISLCGPHAGMVLEPPGESLHLRTPQDSDDLDTGWAAGSSLRPVKLWERQDVSRPGSADSRGQHVVTQNREEEEEGDVQDINPYMPSQTQEELSQSLNTPSRPYARTPTLDPVDQDLTDDEDRTLRSWSSTRTLRTAMTLERSPSEDRRQRRHSDSEPRRALSIPPGTMHRDIDRGVHLESDMKPKSPIEVLAESSSGSMAPLDVDHLTSKEIPSDDITDNEDTENTPGDVVDRDSARVDGQEMQKAMPGKRPRSAYVKWSKEEDELLVQAVAKYGQKWDQVQKALPGRGYHQVRQRWLRKLGVFDNKPDLSTYQTNYFRVSAGNVGTEQTIDPPPKLKLGLAPLSSELAFSGPIRNNAAGDSQTSAK